MTDPLLHYRPCVGVLVLNRAGLVWTGRRAGVPAPEAATAWQMPQGGIDDGESPPQAALRELAEETAMHSVAIVAATPDWLTYDFPADLALGRDWKGKWRGQKQMWFAVQFSGPDSEIDIAGRDGHTPEFADWRWTPIEEVASGVVAFKRDVYRAVVDAFRHLAR